MEQSVDDFEIQYGLGILEELLPPDEAPGRKTLAVGEAFGLRGRVLCFENPLEDGYVVIENGDILEITAQRPQGIPVVETQGVILPGLIDLHGHPEYNVFAPWEPPRAYRNRYQWRRSPEYGAVIKAPWGQLTDKRLLVRYAEVRALVGGVTAIQGARRDFPGNGLVRNVDLPIFGKHIARSSVDPLRASDQQLTNVLRDIQAGKVRAFYIHLAEGTDPASQGEFDQIVAAGLLTSATVIIHGTALTLQQLEQVRQANAKLVWSPQSNLRLYGSTTLAGEALRLGIPLALGADWLPSGSRSLLDEMKVARRQLHEQGYPITPRKLVEMVTRDAAHIAGLGDQLGSLETGRPADLTILESRLPDAWENVAAAEPSWVEMVMIGGVPVYGRAALVRSVMDAAACEPTWAWGKPMLLALPDGGALPGLQAMRTQLIGQFPQLGPVFA